MIKTPFLRNATSFECYKDIGIVAVILYERIRNNVDYYLFFILGCDQVDHGGLYENNHILLKLL